MGKMLVLLRKTAIRMAVAAAFSAAWFKVAGEGHTPANGLVFCGFLYIAAAWFAYLRYDGVKFPSLRIPHSAADMANRFKSILNRNEPRKENTAQQTDEPSSSRQNIASYLLAAIGLIAVSFLFV